VSQRFLRCPHCGLPHSLEEVACPITGRPLEAKRASARAPESDSMRRLQNAVPPSQVDIIRASQHPSQRGGSGPPPSASSSSMQSAQPTPFESLPLSPTIIGQTLGGKYRAMRVLGEGGMGTVYECLHIGLNRRVAVKVLHPTQARKKASVQRFHHEAQVASAIGHPNICEIYDMGEADDGAPFLVMELLQGETLADRIASEGALPFEDVVEIISQVLSGLIAAHEKTIIHRDIKPENVFLSSRPGIAPLAKILDFGISKVAGGEELNLTRTGMVMGTPFYMSPEQARGDRTLDHRVDIYATGVMMYECLTGRRPFTAANYNALLVQILTTNPRPPHDIRPAVPEAFEEVVMKAMHRERDKRYRSAAEMQKALVALRDPVAAGPRRIASIPPEPVPLVTPRRDRAPGPPSSREPAQRSQRERELPAISVDIEGRDLIDSGAQEPSGDSGSIEIPIVHEELAQSPPSGMRRGHEPPPVSRPMYRPDPEQMRQAALSGRPSTQMREAKPTAQPQPTQQPNKAMLPQPTPLPKPAIQPQATQAPKVSQPLQSPARAQPSRAPQPQARPQPQMSRPGAQKPSVANRPSIPPPLPSQRKARMITPTPTPVDPRVLGKLKDADAPWAFERAFSSTPDADPTEIGSIPNHDPTEVGTIPHQQLTRRIDADATERIEPPKVVARVGRRPRTVREVNTPSLPDPRREVEATRDALRDARGESIHRPTDEPSHHDRLPEDEQPTTLFDRRLLKPLGPGVPAASPLRASTTERAPAPTNLGRPPLASSDEHPSPPVVPRSPRRG
jgi:serine/threonine protein kinase